MSQLKISDRLISKLKVAALKCGSNTDEILTESIEVWTGVDKHVKDCLAHISSTHGMPKSWYVNQAIKAYTYGITSSENERAKAKR